MKFVSWNVNGLRACVGKGFLDTFHSMNADFFCLQETKLQAGQIDLDLPGYTQYWNYAQKKGYSGTAIFTRHTPLSVNYGVGVEELDTEGRLITLEYEEFYLVNCYTPNAQRDLARIDHRLRWEAALQDYLAALDAKKPVIYCGDLNVAHKEIDLKNPSANRGNAGFSDEERGAFSDLLERGFADSFRHLYPDVTGAYSWWSYMFNARKNNAGWRIDYFVVSDRLAGSIHDATIHPEVMGSDHCPVGLDLNISCNGSIWTTNPTAPIEANEKKADGESSAGHIRKLIPVAVSMVLTAALLIPIFAVTGKQSATHEQMNSSQQSTMRPTVQSLQPIPKPVVAETINHENSITYYLGYSEQLSASSYIPHYFTNGIHSWELVSNHSSYSPEDNFYVQLIFDNSYLFTSRDLPTVTVKNCETGKVHFYYNENRQIAGCFVSGYAESAFQLQIGVLYASQSITTQNHTILVDIDPLPDLAGWTADELFQYLKYRSNLVNWIYSAQLPDTLVESNPYAKEFAERPEAISILLYDYQYYGNITSVTYLLLTSRLFQNKMDPLEHKQFLELVDQKLTEGDSILYGSLTPIPT